MKSDPSFLLTKTASATPKIRYTNTNQDKLKDAKPRNFGAKKNKENAYTKKKKNVHSIYICVYTSVYADTDYETKTFKRNS